MADCTITVDRDDYIELINVDVRHGLLLDTLFNAARLSYDGKKLVFDAYEISDLVKLIAPFRYDRTFNSLKEMEADET